MGVVERAAARNAAGRTRMPAPSDGDASANWCAQAASWSALVTHFRALLGTLSLPQTLVSSRWHDVLLAHRRMQFVSERLGAAAIFLAVVTLAWIPVDFVLIGGDTNLFGLIVLGRGAVFVAFLAIAGLRIDCYDPQQGIRAIGLTVATGVVFFAYVHAAFSMTGNNDLNQIGHAQYLLMPIALAAGIAIFPLTLLEAMALSCVPLLAVIFIASHETGGGIWIQIVAVIGLMAGVMLTTIVCSVSQLKLLVDLHANSAIDQLTGALVRRVGIELMTIEFAQARRTRRPLAIALLDLDLFKQVNDRYGHDAGDGVLRDVASALRRRLRSGDALIRWGGEEFVVLLPETDAASAAAVMTEICDAGLADRPDGSRQTVSVGLAEADTDALRDWPELLQRADGRLYRAKQAGRNRLVDAHDTVIPFGRPAPTLLPLAELAPDLVPERAVGGLNGDLFAVTVRIT